MNFRNRRSSRLHLMLLAGSALSLFALPINARFNTGAEGGAGAAGTGAGSGAAGSNANGGASGGGGDDWKAKFETASRQAAEAQAAIEAMKKSSPSAADLEELKTFRTKAEEQKKKAAEDERKRMEEQGEYKKLIEQTENQYRGKLTEVETREKTALAQLASERKVSRLSTLIPQHTSVPADAVIRMCFPDDTFSVDQNGNDVIKDEKGIHPLNAKGEKMTRAEFVADVISKTSWLAQHKPDGGSGSRSQTGGATTTGPLSDKDIASMPTEQWNKYKESLGIKTPGRMAG